MKTLCKKEFEEKYHSMTNKEFATELGISERWLSKLLIEYNIPKKGKGGGFSRKLLIINNKNGRDL